MVWYGSGVLCGGVWYGTAWYCIVLYDVVWYGMVWYNMVWYGMVWYGWYGMVLSVHVVHDSGEPRAVLVAQWPGGSSTS